MQQTVPLQHWPELGVQILKHIQGRGGEAMLEEKKSVLSKSNTKAFLDIALSHTSNYDHIAKACNLVEMHVMMSKLLKALD